MVINPGNPTGQVLERGNQEDLVRFCKQVRGGTGGWRAAGGGGCALAC